MIKELFPIPSNDEISLAGDNKYITQEQFDDLVAIVNQNTFDISTEHQNLLELISSLASVITTQVLHITDNADIVAAQITNATIDNILANTATIEQGDIERLRSTDFAQFKDVAISGMLNAIDALYEGKVTANEIEAPNIKATTKIEAPVIDATTINADTLNIETLNVDTYNVESVIADSVDATASTIGNADITEANIDDLEATAATITSQTSDNIDVTNVTHTINRLAPQIIDKNQHGDYYVRIPKIENGEYRVYAMNSENTTLLWSMTFHVEKNKPYFDWYRNPIFGVGPFLSGVKLVGDDDVYVCAHTRGQSHNLYWSSMAKDASVAPTIYDDPPLVAEDFFINENDGTYFTGLVNLALDKVPTEELTLSNTDDVAEASSATVTFNGLLPVHYASYVPDQNVNTDSDVIHKTINTDHIKENGTVGEGTSLLVRNDDDENELYKVRDDGTNTTEDIIKGFKKDDADYTLTPGRPLVINDNDQIVTPDETEVDDLIDNGLTASKYVMTDADKKLISIDAATVTNGILSNEENKVVDATTLSEWNGKTSVTEEGVTTYTNNITKLGDVDEGNFDMPNTSHIDMNHSLYVGPELASLSSMAVGALMIEW